MICHLNLPRLRCRSGGDFTSECERLVGQIFVCRLKLGESLFEVARQRSAVPRGYDAPVCGIADVPPTPASELSPSAFASRAARPGDYEHAGGLALSQFRSCRCRQFFSCWSELLGNR